MDPLRMFIIFLSLVGCYTLKERSHGSTFGYASLEGEWVSDCRIEFHPRNYRGEVYPGSSLRDTLSIEGLENLFTIRTYYYSGITCDEQEKTTDVEKTSYRIKLIERQHNEGQMMLLGTQEVFFFEMPDKDRLIIEIDSKSQRYQRK